MNANLEIWSDKEHAIGSGASTSPELPIKPLGALPPIAGFWRRCAAFIVDGIFLGLLELAIWGIPKIIGSQGVIWFELGPYGRLIGLALTLAYFGLLDSGIGDGRTIGKRLLGIAVRDGTNKPIGIGRSIIRTSIWAIPITFNGSMLPVSVLQTPVLVWLLIVIIGGLVAAILYTMVFNRHARQGLHDMVCGTYVINFKGQPITTFPQTARIHWITSGVLVALVAVLAAVGIIIIQVPGTKFNQILQVQQMLISDSRLFSVEVYDSTQFQFYEGGKSNHVLKVKAWFKGLPSDEERARMTGDIALALLDRVDNIDQYDLMQILVISGYDFGITNFMIKSDTIHPISMWKEKVGAVAYNRGDYAAAARLIHEAAGQGDAQAQNNLGVLYERGQGVTQVYEAAAQWYSKAAEQGLALAQYNLGVLYARGQGVEQDFAVAERWFRKAAEQGFAFAQKDLGVLYYQGQGVAQDYTAAAEWSRKAAEQGNTQAQYNLGVMYKEGQGVQQDFTVAAEWFRKAAEQGDAQAQFNLGVLYDQGDGVKQDYAEAMKWYRKAADQGFAPAQNNIGDMYETGRGVVQDYVTAVEWYSKAAKQGLAVAQLSIGNLYAKGHGIAQDHIQALMWLKLAAAGLPAESQEKQEVETLMHTLTTHMTPAQIEEAQQRARDWKPTQ